MRVLNGRREGAEMVLRVRCNPFQVSCRHGILPIFSQVQNRRGLKHSPGKGHHSNERLRGNKGLGIRDIETTSL